MEHVKYTVGVHPHGTAHRRRVGPVANRVNQLANWRRWHLVFLIAFLHVRALATLPAHTRLDVDARLGRIARLARVESVCLVGGRDAIPVAERPVRVGPLSLRVRMPVILGGCGVAFLAGGIAGRVLDAVYAVIRAVDMVGRVSLALALRGGRY